MNKNLEFFSEKAERDFQELRRRAIRGSDLTSAQLEKRRASSVSSPNAEGRVAIELFQQKNGHYVKSGGSSLKIVGLHIEENGVIGIDVYDQTVNVVGTLSIACPELAWMLTPQDVEPETDEFPKELPAGEVALEEGTKDAN